MLVNGFTNASNAMSCSILKLVIVAYIAPTERFHVHLSKSPEKLEVAARRDKIMPLADVFID